jgi:hypothetical protein
MVLNELQKRYKELRAIYEEAFEAGDWDTVEEVESDYIETEAQLIEKGLEIAGKHMRKEYVETIRQNWTDERYTDRIVGLMLRLQA